MSRGVPPLAGLAATPGFRNEGGFDGFGRHPVPAGIETGTYCRKQGRSNLAFEMTEFLSRVRQLLRAPQSPGPAALGVSPQMVAIESTLRRMSALSAPVLLTGNTGAGKEVCARYLHGLRTPKRGPFIAVNCAAIPKDLMETELFGPEKGAFTGATSRHHGYAERARDGTLFLDEIGEFDHKLHAKLLRLLDDRTFHRVGGETAVPFAGRLVCATNADVPARVRAGSFREDLLYRGNVLTISIPPLRERPDDIEWLAERFLDRLCLAHQSIEDEIGLDAAHSGSNDRRFP